MADPADIRIEDRSVMGMGVSNREFACHRPAAASGDTVAIVHHLGMAVIALQGKSSDQPTRFIILLGGNAGIPVLVAGVADICFAEVIQTVPIGVSSRKEVRRIRMATGTAVDSREFDVQTMLAGGWQAMPDIRNLVGVAARTGRAATVGNGVLDIRQGCRGTAVVIMAAVTGTG